MITASFSIVIMVNIVDSILQGNNSKMTVVVNVKLHVDINVKLNQNVTHYRG